MSIRHTVSIVAVLISALVAGCERNLVIAVPQGSPLSVIELASHTNDHNVTVENPVYQQLATWVTRNQSGWTPYLVTPPALGFVVQGNGFHMQFFGSTVLVHTPDGPFEKRIDPSEYEFLKES